MIVVEIGFVKDPPHELSDRCVGITRWTSLFSPLTPIFPSSSHTGGLNSGSFLTILCTEYIAPPPTARKTARVPWRSPFAVMNTATSEENRQRERENHKKRDPSSSRRISRRNVFLNWVEMLVLFSYVLGSVFSRFVEGQVRERERWLGLFPFLYSRSIRSLTLKTLFHNKRTTYR